MINTKTTTRAYLCGLGLLPPGLLGGRGLLFLLRSDERGDAGEGSLQRSSSQYVYLNLEAKCEERDDARERKQNEKNVSAKESGEPRGASNGTR